MSIRQNNVYYGIRKTIYITVSGKTTYITVSVRLETRCHDAITAVYDARHVYDRLAVVLLIAKHYQELKYMWHQHLGVPGNPWQRKHLMR